MAMQSERADSTVTLKNMKIPFQLSRRNANRDSEITCRIGTFGKSIWEMYVKEDDAVIRLFLCRISCLPFTFPTKVIHVWIEVLSGRNQVLPGLDELSENLTLDSTSFKYGYAWIWRRSSWDVERVVPNFVLNRLLIFRITLELGDQDLSQKYREVAVQTSLNINPIPCFESLSEDLSKVLKGKNWDPDVVELICEGQTIIGHKMILCSRSPVLAAMLKGDMKTNRAGVVEIQDMDIDTFQRFLRYLYHGNLDDTVTFDSYMRLYKAGDIYQVEALKKRCSRFLIENLTVDNANGVRTLAEAHGDSFFVDAVASFLLEKKDFPLGQQYDDFLARWLALHLQFSNL